MEFALEVSQLGKTFPVGLGKPDKTVLTDVTFQVPAGKTTGFVGGNGQGKTTTLKCILQFVFADKGEVRYWGRPFGRDVQARIGFLPERPYYYDFLTAAEFLEFHWRLAGRKKSELPPRLKAILEQVELESAAHQRIRSFSKGMLQRLGIAQALLCEPDLLILDEPMSGLDPDGRLLVKDILREQKQKGTTIFFSSHLLADMDELCDHLVVIDKGRCLFNGTPAGFRESQPDLEAAFREFRRRQKGSVK